MVTLKTAVYRNAYQENEPVRPDDKSAVRREGKGSKLIVRREMAGIRWAMAELDVAMDGIGSMVEGEKTRNGIGRG